jgi:hypothetical protein
MKLAATLDARAKALQDLQRIPGVGPSLACDLFGLGITRVPQLRNKSPERLYARLGKQVGTNVDRCVLYVFRCAVYFAESDQPEPRLLKWWNWKDDAKKSIISKRPSSKQKMLNRSKSRLSSAASKPSA